MCAKSAMKNNKIMVANIHDPCSSVGYFYRNMVMMNNESLACFDQCCCCCFSTFIYTEQWFTTVVMPRTHKLKQIT